MLTSPISFVIMGKDPQERAQARVQLLSTGKVHVVAESSELARGAELVEEFHPQSALIIINGDSDQALDLVRQISEEHPSTAVICTGGNIPSSVIVKSYRSGATDFLPQPLKLEEIEEVLTKIDAMRSRSESEVLTGRVFAIYSSRGGTGVTTMAVNLASQMARLTRENTVLVDLNLQYGAMPLFFGLDPEYTIADVVRNQDRLDAQLLKSFLMRTGDNLYCLPAPLRVEEADDVQPAHVQRIVTMLRSQFTYVVVDCQHTLDVNTVTVLDLADTILLVSLVDVPSVYCTKRVLDVFRKMGFPEEKIKVVVNCYDKRDGVPIEKVQEVFGMKIETVLAEDHRSVLSSINMGHPLVVSQPKSPLVKQFSDLAGQFTGRSREAAHAKPKKWGFNLFGGVLGNPNE
ncbi:MAG: AAA family ATPase [Acidobacteriota bacterium]|nr:AAA family ATPase [Blastocatellia bacterium]MDW8240872.1 AAA family ATPase [Acidobacteriota bacterium]